MGLTLEQIAQHKMPPDGRGINLPRVQRGLVWNAVREEVLWDSILRGLPIGTFIVKDASSEWELMDGQQRSNAISMAFADKKLQGLTSERLESARAAASRGESNSYEDAYEPILWVDIANSDCTVEQGELCNEMAGNATRRYFFKVTTAAHPWGYGNSDSETSNERFSERDKQEALTVAFKDVGHWRIGDRPLPYEVWPTCAAFPVPMAVVVAFVKESSDLSLESFRTWCQGHEWIRASNWFRFNGFEAHAQLDCKKSWDRIVGSVKNALSSYQVAVNVVKVEPEDVGVYFSRMNKAGVEPTVEDIQYCLLKDSLRATIDRGTWKRVDEYALKVGISSSRLVSLAVRFVQNNDKDVPEKLKGELKLSEVLACKDEIGRFLLTGIEGPEGRRVSLFDLIDEAIKRFCGSDLVLRWVLRDVAVEDDGIVFLWYLRHVALGTDVSMPGKLTDTGLVTYLAWFAEDVSSVVREMWKYGRDVRSGLYRAMRGGSCGRGLLQPITEAELSLIEGVLDGESVEGLDFVRMLRNGWNDDIVKQRLARIWCGFAQSGKKCDFEPTHGRSLLVFACRKYLQDIFRGYVPGQPQWMEQNTPWDFDHVFPKAWLQEDIGDPTMMAAYSSLVWSIGNALPVPFQINRTKNAQPADCSYPYRAGEVPLEMVTAKGGCVVERAGAHLTPSLMEVARKSPAPGKSWFDAQEPELVFNFCRETFRRFKALYLDWYETCGISSVWEVADAKVAAEDVRNRLMKALLERGKRDGLDCRLWYVSGNHEYKVKSDWDLLHPWVSFGVRVKGALIAVSADDFNGLNFEVGLRKSPDASCADAEWGQKLSQQLAESGALLGKFCNVGWWYYYQSPRKISTPNYDVQLEKADKMFKSVYAVIRDIGLLDDNVTADRVGATDSALIDEQKGELDTGLDMA